MVPEAQLTAAQQAAGEAQAAAALARENAQTLRDQIQQQVRQQVRDATNQARNVGRPEPAVAPEPPPPPRPPGTIIIPSGDGGDPISINVDGQGIHVSQNGSETVIPIHDVIPRGVVQMTYSVSAAFVLVIVGFPLARAFARWLDRRGAANRVSSDVQQRLDAMDRNIDTIAVELERVSEGQRFTAKLLSERTQMPAADFVAAGARVPATRSDG